MNQEDKDKIVNRAFDSIKGIAEQYELNIHSKNDPMVHMAIDAYCQGANDGVIQLEKIIKEDVLGHIISLLEREGITLEEFLNSHGKAS